MISLFPPSGLTSTFVIFSNNFSYGGPFGKGDYLGCYLDLDNLEIYYTKNGQDLGLAFSISRHQQTQTFFPAVVLKVYYKKKLCFCVKLCQKMKKSPC